jgi:hypothetical protein
MVVRPQSAPPPSHCRRCPFVNGVCEDRVNRGRGFFLVGALALPVARKIELAAPVARAAENIGVSTPRA